jgi:hypothetical protein
LAKGAAVSNPLDLVMDLMYGRWRTQTLYAGVKLGIFDVIKREPKNLIDVAHELDLDETLLYRLLRTLCSLGLLIEPRPYWFSITEAGEFLRSDHPESLRDLILLREGPEHTAVWKHLPAIVRDGVQNGFVREFGRSAFDYAVLEPNYGAAFDAGMSSHSRLQTGWVLEALRDYDFASIALVCDIGGGRGHLLCHLLARYPHLQGTVLERPGVLENKQELWANKLHVEDRCRYVPGDMFVDVPTADAYLMKMILHDWNDDECVHILKNIYDRAPTAGRIFIIEHVISDKSNFASLFDMHMLVWGTGRERTEDEYSNLFKEAGWKYQAAWYPLNRIMGVIEGVKQ